MNAVIPLAAGFLAGAAGAMGLGGGFVLILYLSWTGLSVPEARAANLMFFIPTALVSMLINKRSGLIDTSVVPYAAAAGSIGAVVGLMISDTTDPTLLGKVFALLIIAVGIRELFHHRYADRRAAKKKQTAAQA
jgi:Sulfite exporter TauE/SafE.